MELWERSASLDLLDELLRDSARGGRLVVVAGEAGMGKSALVTEFAERCGPAARVLWGSCDPLVTPRALGPLHDIGRQTGGNLAARLRAGAAQDEIFDAFLDEIAVPRGPRPVVVVEDVHWADGATLDWLAFLGRRIQRIPALLVVTYRDDEVGPDHPLRGALAAQPNAALRRVPLPALSRECVVEQARRAGRDPELVRRLAGGNPLLVTELLKAGDSAVPAAVQDLILDRIRALPPAARDLAHAVAVVPTRAEPAIIAGASDALETCIACGVLVPAGDGLAFRHELLRSAVEASLTPARRAILHRRVLNLLSRVADVDPGRLVHHARMAGDNAAVLRHGQQAGAGAARQGAHREAAAHYAAAAAYADRLPAAARADLLEQYAFEAYLAGLPAEGLRARQAALVLREDLGDAERAGENLRWISRLSWQTGGSERAREAAARAVVVLEAVPETRQLAMTYSNRSQLHTLANEFDDAIAWAERARGLAERLGDVETAVHATINEMTARLAEGDPAAPAGLRAAHERAVAHGLVDHAARALVNLAAVTPDELAQYAAAEPLLDDALQYTEEHDLDGYRSHLLGYRARVRFKRCDWTGALADADEVLARPGRHAHNAVQPLVVRGRILGARDDPDALPALDEAAHYADGLGDVQYVAPVADARSELFLWLGDAERARTEASRGLDLALSVHGQPFVLGRLTYRLRRAGGTGDVPANAAAPYRMMIRGEWAQAAAEWARRGATYIQAEALADGDLAAATEALRILDGVGATRAADHVRARLRERGFTRIPRGPAATTRDNPGGLTARQVEVLALLAAGATNAEIAERLVLSVRTVDHHVSAILAKLGATTRRDAAAAAARLGVTTP